MLRDNLPQLSCEGKQEFVSIADFTTRLCPRKDKTVGYFSMRIGSIASVVKRTLTM